MSFRCIAGVLVPIALAIGTADVAAQVTSERRISISKGEVVSVDTVQRVDTLRVVDTVRIVEVDTIREVLPPLMRRLDGLYWGLGTGASLPAANFNDPSKPGWRIEMPFGIDASGAPLGLRFNVGYSQYRPHSWATSFIDDAQIVNADALLKLRLAGEFFRRNVEFYGLAGGTYQAMKDVLRVNRKTGEMKVGESDSSEGLDDHDWVSAFGYAAGAGVQVGWGATNVFTEVRYTRVGSGGWPVAHVPLVVGVILYR
jgi:hypothetical protein